MNLKSFIAGCFALVLSAAAFDAGAVPARRGLTPKYQPDGSIVNVEIRGDERGHVVLSEDGHLLIADNAGRYCYATFAVDGSVVASQVMARSVADRDAAELRFVESLPKPGVLESRLRADAEASRLQSRAAAVAKPGLCDTRFPSTGEIRTLIILVNYSDVEMTLDNPHDYFYRWANETSFSDFGATGSICDYFIDQSLGAFRPQFDVYGPVTLPKTRRYYGQNVNDYDYRAHEMAIDACKLLDDEIDFTVYDLDHDGLIDNVYIVYAGLPESGRGGPDTVWPHSADISWYGKRDDVVFDGKTLDHYACSSELETTTIPTPVGTFCHEFSHVLGLPDLYDTAGQMNNQTPDEWSVLDQGTYLNDGRTPLGYGLFERYALGWASPRILDRPDNITLSDVTTGDGALIPALTENEYFLLENRQQRGWDAYAPSTGLLIWHIDYSKRAWDENSVNNDMAHQRVDIEEADGKTGSYYNRANAGNTFPGTSGNTSFTASSTPAMLTWDNIDLGMPITDIAEKNGRVTFKVAGGSTSADAIAADATEIRCEGLSLTVTCATAVPATVHSADGRCIATFVAEGSTDLTLPAAGIYIVSAGEKSVKIAAR